MFLCFFKRKKIFIHISMLLFVWDKPLPALMISLMSPKMSGERWSNSAHFVSGTIRRSDCETVMDVYNHLKLLLISRHCFLFLFSFKSKHLRNYLLLFMTLFSGSDILLFLPYPVRKGPPTPQSLLLQQTSLPFLVFREIFTPSSSFCPLVCSTAVQLMTKQNPFK